MILDATAGGRGIWLDEHKDRDDTAYVDRRIEEKGFMEGPNRYYSVLPSIRADNRNLPFQDETFDLAVFDPPHKTRTDGMEQITGVINKKYGTLEAETWQSDLRSAFDEIWRTLKPSGTLCVKWADSVIHHDKVLSTFPYKPLFGTTVSDRKSSTCRWYIWNKKQEVRE